MTQEYVVAVVYSPRSLYNIYRDNESIDSLVANNQIFKTCVAAMSPQHKLYRKLIFVERGGVDVFKIINHTDNSVHMVTTAIMRVITVENPAHAIDIEIRHLVTYRPLCSGDVLIYENIKTGQQRGILHSIIIVPNAKAEDPVNRPYNRIIIRHKTKEFVWYNEMSNIFLRYYELNNDLTDISHARLDRIFDDFMHNESFHKFLVNCFSSAN
jgi:hypothetical protein